MDTQKFLDALKIANEAFEKYGFSAGDVVTEGEKAVITYEGENGTMTISYENEKLTMVNEASKRLVYALLPVDASDKDVKFVGGEIAETLDDKFGVKAPVAKKQNGKIPQTVSKAAVKNGSFYDANSLASKLAIVFPEIREEHKAHVEEYGEFLANDFFEKHVTPRVIEAIKKNQPGTMKKMFQFLNEMYEDGTNELQSLIAVTILGALDNDQILLARCVDYMSDTMTPPVIEVNKLLASSKGKKLKEKLKNPPAYKPPKAKKPGMMERMMGAQQPSTLNNN